MSRELSVALCIIAKLPRPGACKTRLSPACTPDEAADLSRAFVSDTIANVVGVARATGARAWVAYSPNADENELKTAFGYDVRTLAQRGDDFGERLRYAIVDLLALGHRAVCVIGSDSPTLPSCELARAVELCDGNDRVVLGPAADGGYYLLGVSRPHPTLFSGIAWSTSIVAEQTVACATVLGLSLHLLASWYDVDEPTDLERLRYDLSGKAENGAFDAPATRAVVARLSMPRETVSAERDS